MQYQLFPLKTGNLNIKDLSCLFRRDCNSFLLDEKKASKRIQRVSANICIRKDSMRKTYAICKVMPHSGKGNQKV